MQRFDFRTICAEAKVNQMNLNSCAGPHDFKTADINPRLSGPKYRCSRCRGFVDQHAYHWYLIGLAHARPAVSPEGVQEC